MRKKEEILLKHLDDYGLDIFSKQELINAKILNVQQLNIALASLIKSRYIDILEKGKYCKHNFREHFVIGSFLVNDGIISYWNAMNYHGLTEQIPNVIYVKTSKDKRANVYFGIRYFFTRKTKKTMSGFITVGYGNHTFRISNIERTIVDAFDKPNLSGGYAEIIKAFNNADIKATKLIEYCKEENNVSLIKRLAYLTDLLNKPGMNLFLDFAKSKMKNKYTLFEINGEPNGKTNKTWRIIQNIPENEIIEMAES
ncbi:MAG: type IV toxin-antitoxin system AbiEi family antitoxin [Bacteroidota bacterium]|nr:type IV toxin-antitoxin system AbiEi family antitoxin [Bacteroidota bacterium]